MNQETPSQAPSEATLPLAVQLPDLAMRLVGPRWVLWLALATWFLWPLVQNPYQIGTMHDAAYFLHHAEAAYRSWHDYGQLPVWNPYFCGGIPGLGNLQESSVSPSILPQLLLGLMPGMALALLLWFAVGLEGAWLYARKWGATPTSAVLAAIAFAFSGRFVAMFADGQPAFVGFQLTPWVLLGFELGMRQRWAAAGGGVAMALIFLEGGAVATPLLGVLMLWLLPLHVGARALSNWRTAHKPLISLLIIGAVAVLVSAVRLLPVVESLLRWPREWHAEGAVDFKMLWEMLMVKSSEGGYAGPGTAYVGIPMLVLSSYAALRRPSKGLPLLLFAVLAVALGMGDQRPWAPWALTTKLPILKNLRCSFRMTFFVTLFIGTGAAVAMGALQRDLRALLAWLLRARDAATWRHSLAWALAGLAALAATLPFAAGPMRFNRARMLENTWEDVPREAKLPFAQSLGNRWEAQMWPASGLGSIGCFEEQPYPTSPLLRGDLAAEEYLVEPAAGTVVRREWTPHRIELAVDLKKAAVLRVNQNFHRGWRASQGQIQSDDGLLAIALPPGKYDLTLRHRDPVVWLGVAISVTTLLVLAALAGVQWRRRRATFQQP